MGLSYMWMWHTQERKPLGITFDSGISVKWNEGEREDGLTELEISVNRNEIEHFYGPNIEGITALTGEDSAETTRIGRNIFDIFQGKHKFAPIGSGLIWSENHEIFVVSVDPLLYTVVFEKERHTFENVEWKTQKDQISIHMVFLGKGKFLNRVEPFYFTNISKVCALMEVGKYKGGTRSNSQRTPFTLLRTIEQWSNKAFLEEEVLGFQTGAKELKARYAEIYFKLQLIQTWMEYDKIFKEDISLAERKVEVRVSMGSLLQILSDSAPKQYQGQSPRYMFEAIDRMEGVLERVYILLLANTLLICGTQHEKGPELWKMVTAEYERSEEALDLPTYEEWLEKLGSLERLLVFMRKRFDSKKLRRLKKIIQALREMKDVLETNPDVVNWEKGNYRLDSDEGRKQLGLYEWLIGRESPLWRGALEIELPKVPSRQIEFVQLFGSIAKFIKEESKERSKTVTHLLILDEAEGGLNPKQQQRLIAELTDFLGSAFPECRFQILLTTNSPMILSDLTAKQVWRVVRDQENPESIVTEEEKIATFGGNPYDLFCRGLSMDEGTTGIFAQKKISQAIRAARLGRQDQGEMDARELAYIKDSIGEPLIQDYIKQILNPDGNEYREFHK